MRHLKFKPFASAPAQRCYYCVVHTYTSFSQYTCIVLERRRIIANAPALTTGRAPARIPIMLDQSLAHRHRMSVVGQRARAARRR